MSTSQRICETCVYCSFAGNCDRYNKPLTSIEQPACDAYEIHPLLAENTKLRELVRGLWYCTENENKAICEGCPLGTVEGDRLALACEKLMYELGVDA